MYEKVFSSHKSSKSKFNIKRLMKGRSKKTLRSEIDRCKDLEQRDNYRRLIEQYGHKTLAETASIPLSSSKISQGVIRDNSLITNIVNSPKPLISPFVLKNSQQQNIPDDSLRELNNKPSVSTSTQQNGSSGGRSFSSSIPTVPSRTYERSEEGRRQRIESSHYMSPTFIDSIIKKNARLAQARKRIALENETKIRCHESRRAAENERLEELMRQKLSVSQEPVIADLTPEMDDAVDDALCLRPPGQLLVENFNIRITREDMNKLSGLQWLNDELINYYMELIVDRSKKTEGMPKCHAMNTFFYPKLSTQSYKSVRRWTKKVDIFSLDLVFYPIHLGVHWTLAVVDFRSKEINYYDSMGSPNAKCLHHLRQYLSEEHANKKGTPYDTSDWTLSSIDADIIPQQMNGSDCGVFACTFAEFISRDADLAFEQSDMPLIRRTMVWEILNGALRR